MHCHCFHVIIGTKWVYLCNLSAFPVAVQASQLRQHSSMAALRWSGDQCSCHAPDLALTLPTIYFGSPTTRPTSHPIFFCIVKMSSMLTTVPQACPFTAATSISIRPRSVMTPASLHRSQAQQPLRVQFVDCAKVRRQSPSPFRSAEGLYNADVQLGKA